MGLWRKRQISFQLTSQCSLACVYCYMPKIRETLGSKVIDLGFAKAGLVDFFKTSPTRNIRFFSPGEPTQAFERMAEITEMARGMAGDDLRVELVSNGYFDDDVADWIEDNVDTFYISCDGPPDLQYPSRIVKKKAFQREAIYEHIKRFSRCPDMEFGILAVMLEKNIGRQKELIEFFHGLGVKNLCAQPVYRSEVNDVKATSLVEFAEYFVPAFFKAKELGMFYQTMAIANFDEKVGFYCQAHVPTPRLTPDGYVSCCDWASLGPETLKPEAMKDLIYGRYDAAQGRILYDQAKIDRIRRRNASYLEKMGCNGCEALDHCAGGCVGKMVAQTNDLYRASKDWCDAVRYLHKRLPVNEGLFPFIHP